MQNEDMPLQSSDITVVDGRIVFANEDVYNDHISWIFENQLNEEVINEFYSNLGFVSMLNIYEGGMKINEFEEFLNFTLRYPRVFEPVTYEDGTISYECEGLKLHSYFSNADGIYQIGNKICRMSWDTYYEISNGDEDLVPLLFDIPEKIVNENVFVETRSIDTKRTQYYYATNYFDPDHRLVSRHYRTTIGYPRYYYLRTTAQRKGWFSIWKQEDISYIHLSWDQGYYCFYPGGFQNIVNASSFNRYDDSDIDILAQITDQDIDFSASYLWTTHEGTRSGTTKTRSLDAW